MQQIAYRPFMRWEVIASTVRAAIAIARQVHARYRQHRNAQATYDALRRLDDNMLRDLGFDRSEMTSIAAEVTGDAERTRTRVLLMSHTQP